MDAIIWVGLWSFALGLCMGILISSHDPVFKWLFISHSTMIMMKGDKKKKMIQKKEEWL